MFRTTRHQHFAGAAPISVGLDHPDGEGGPCPLPRPETHDFLAPLPLPFHLPTRVYGTMLAIWHHRLDLQRRFPLQKGSAREFLRYLAWCAADGRRRYLILRSIPEWDAELSRPIELPAIRGDRWEGAYSVAMFLFGVSKSYYTFGPMLASGSARDAFARAWWRGVRHERCMPPPDAWQVADLARRFGDAAGLAAAIRGGRGDAEKSVERLVEDYGLSDVFDRGPAAAVTPGPDDQSSQGDPARAGLPGNLRRSPVALPLFAARWIGRMLYRMRKCPPEFELANITARIPVTRRAPTGERGPFGVNLFGYAKGELGIGEDVRMLAMALKANGIPCCIVDVQPGPHVSQMDASADEWVAGEPRYAVNIVCMTGIEHARFVCEKGLDLLAGRYTIGIWPWELADWPASCRYAFATVDEIWGISGYAANAYRNAPCPVYPMSLPVMADPVGTETRRDFGLPEDDFLFFFAFDFNSTLARKNPEGAIRAFRQAFPARGGDRVGLVIKVSHSANAKGREWERIKAMITSDPRIRLIDATLRRASVLALYRCCDCFVSPHRAEGFGRSIAEALLLDLPVIATGYSGNMDYCDGERVSLVRYRLRELKPREYFWGQGQQWAEPDLEHAAGLMRRMLEAPRASGRPGFDFSPATVGRRYARRLEEIFHQLNASVPSPC